MIARWPFLIVVLTVLLGVSAPAQAADPGQAGQWSALQQYPLVPISAAVTADGKIVAWDQADSGSPHGISPNNGKAMILDPETGRIERSVNLAPASVFCPLITTLPDGRIAIAGGGNGSVNSDLVQVFDPKSQAFRTWSKMSVGRWYPGGSISKFGDIVALGGQGGSGADVVDAATGTNRRLNVNFGADWYPLALRMPDGRFTIENVTDLQSGRPATRQILDTTGAGTLTGAGNLTLLKQRKRMTATMVGPYTMLGITGGRSREAYLLDASTGGQPVPTATGSTKDPHITGTAVTLPDGSALVVGGNSSGSETYGTPVMGVERWSPTTGQWSSMANTPRQRQYHSVSALLPDGRVWSAGTSINGRANEYNGAYFSPPYLFKQDGSGELAPRPQITDAPASVSWGQRLTLRSPQAASIRKASLVRLSATTHQYDFSGAFVPLDVTVSGDQVSVDVPSNGNAVPAGSYMVFLLDSAGVPSKAATVQIDPSDLEPVAPRLTLTKTAQTDTTVTVNVANTGTGAGTIQSVTLPGAGWTQTSGPGAPFTVEAGGAETLTLTRGSVSGDLVLTPAGGDALRLALEKAPPAAEARLTLSMTRQTWSRVKVRVANTGTGSARIESIRLPGSGWRQIRGPRAPFTVSAGRARTITLTRGWVNGTLVVTPTTGPALELGLIRRKFWR